MRDWSVDIANAVIRQYKLTAKMIGVLASGRPSTQSARVIGHEGSIAALQRRGMVGNDRRWTARGMRVAKEILTDHVMDLDELHAEALTEDASRGNGILIDARNLMIDRRGMPDSVDFRALTKEIQFAAESGPDVPQLDPWNIHSWHWCIQGTRGYRRAVHPR